MPSSQHEAVIELIRQQPAVAAKLLSDQLGVDVPGFRRARLEAAELPDLKPTEYRADAVVTLRDAGQAEKPVLGLVVEVQLGRDAGKRWSWPVYVTTLRARLRCPVLLMVVCADSATAAWCATPIELGHPGLVLIPLVLGPEQLPVTTDIDQIRDTPELAVLSAMAHGNHPEHLKILHALAGALAMIDQEQAIRYAEIVLAALPEAQRHSWEDLMTTQTFEFQSAYARRLLAEGKAEGRAEGRVEGEARLVLAVLDARNIHVPDDARARITECSDPDQLEAWGRRAATIDGIDQLFD
jgi:hypothetical protein